MRRPLSHEPRLARGSLTEEAHAHVCMNGFGEGGEVEAVLWAGRGGAAPRSHISTVTPGFASAAEPRGLALSGAEARHRSG